MYWRKALFPNNKNITKIFFFRCDSVSVVVCVRVCVVVWWGDSLAVCGGGWLVGVSVGCVSGGLVGWV